MSRHFDLEADLQHLNLEFNESAFGILDSPFTTNTPAWDVPGDGLMANTYECQELNQAIQLSGYLQPINPLIEGVLPLPPCFCGPPLQPNLMDIPRPVEVDFNAEYARFMPGSEMHSSISSVHPGLLDKVATAVPTTFDSDIDVIPEPIKRSRGRPIVTAMPTTYDSYMAKTREPIKRGRGRPTARAVPITSESYMAQTQEPIKRGRGRPKGSKTKQHVSLLASRRNIPMNSFETHFS